MYINKNHNWQFWIDRGGTFTDVIGLDNQGGAHHIKVLSERQGQYKDAAIYAIKRLLGLSDKQAIPKHAIASIKMGTTVATNALLEYKGEKTLLCITAGFADMLEIGYQTRPKLFDLHIKKPKLLYTAVLEAAERLDANGKILKSLDYVQIQEKLSTYYQQGFRSIAICLMHAYDNPEHEIQIGKIAKVIGFKQISLSHQTSAMMKLIARSDTTVIDAYLSPILKRYINQLEGALKNSLQQPLQFMRSDGGLSQPRYFHGKDAILSGPAGGVVGMVSIGKQAGFDKLIGFDMGGTSTDVCHYYGDYERTSESDITGVRLQTPMMKVHTVAAGGGSILHFEDGRFVVGPDSAGANPGPACYGRDGPLTVTDCNVLLGRIQPDYFPKVFGKSHTQALDVKIVKQKFNALQTEINSYLQSIGKEKMPIEAIAWGFLQIAVINMANAIKKISVEEGYDIREHSLCCFGGAAGQHACMVADILDIKSIIIHPMASLLSALGIGLASLSTIKEKQIDVPLNAYSGEADEKKLLQIAQKELLKQGAQQNKIRSATYLLLRYNTSETTLKVPLKQTQIMHREFETQHQQLFGFTQSKTPIIVDRMQVELIEDKIQVPPKISDSKTSSIDFEPKQTSSVYYADKWYNCQIIAGRHNLQLGETLTADNQQIMLVETTGTNLIDSTWSVAKDEWHNLILSKQQNAEGSQNNLKLENNLQQVDPILLEVFNNQFMAIAEQMGSTLAKTAQSVNIRERLDFSCAIFNAAGDLVANANHIPVHLGSMSDSVRALIHDPAIKFKPGDVYMLNNPYQGGTHLPDITVVTPVFDNIQKNILFFTASRGHHSDVGGIEPGSAPAFSTHIEQEGVVISNFQIVKNRKFLDKEVTDLLSSGENPCRNIVENIADIKAQIAANERGSTVLEQLVQQKGQDTVLAYMGFIQDNAEEMVRKVISRLADGKSCYPLDNGSKICVSLGVNHQGNCVDVDFTGTSKQHSGNFNAPISVCYAAVLYVFRCLIDKNIPLNQGCLKPINIIVPEGSFLNPQYPAAVIAGNTEVSQAIVEALFGALGILAGSQGTMNNFIYGNEHYQNYETICGGAGAGNGFAGASAVHTHMTNTRMTDPEVLERRYPVRIEEFSIRKDSAGEGQYPGGHGICRKIRFLQPMQVNVLSSNRNHQPYGMAGGSNGSSGANYIQRAQSNQIIELKGVDCCDVAENDVFIMLTPGGGGYGKKSSF